MVQIYIAMSVRLHFKFVHCVLFSCIIRPIIIAEVRTVNNSTVGTRSQIRMVPSLTYIGLLAPEKLAAHVSSKDRVRPRQAVGASVRPRNRNLLFDADLSMRCHVQTRSQAVVGIADRTASQHLWGHVTSSVVT